MLCSVVKHAGSGQSTKEVEGETRNVVEKRAKEKSEKCANMVQLGRCRYSFSSALCFVL